MRSRTKTRRTLVNTKNRKSEAFPTPTLEAQIADATTELATVKGELSRQIAQRTKAEEELKRSSRHIGDLLTSIQDGFMELDRDWRFAYINQRAASNVGSTPAELIGKNIWELFPKILGSPHEFYYRKAMTERIAVHFEIEGVLTQSSYEISVYPSAEGISVFWRDITERKRAEEQLRSLSLTDELTGLNSRRGFMTLATQEVKLAARFARRLCLLFIDLDNMKQINDTLGHAAGDKALAEMAHILRSTFRESDIIARWGGDEFVVLAPLTAQEDETTLVTRLDQKVESQCLQNQLGYQLSISLGLSQSNPEEPLSIDELLARADHSMYSQKRSKQRTSEN